jgi:ABC-type sugar transport system ATPase subunit
MAVVELENVSKSYGALEVNEGLDLRIEDGSFTVFVGPSGCGKSTLLRMIAGLEPITSGEVQIDGRRVNEAEPIERGVAMVFQNYALYPHMTVEQNIGFSLRMARLSREQIATRVAAAAATLQIEPLMKRRPAELSGGQRQRVAIGRAIVRDPEVFLFDEPLSNLDAELRVATRKELAALHAEIGGTMIYVTHDQVEAMTLADRIVVLRSGRIEQVGTPLELYNRPDNLFVAGFIGSPRMNLLPGRVTADGKVALGEGGHEVACATGSLAAGAKVTLGIRPEHLALAPEGQGLPLSVDLVERLGGESYLYGTSVSLPQITLRLDGQSEHERGHSVALAFPQQSLHLFDEAGRAIRP